MPMPRDIWVYDPDVKAFSVPYLRLTRQHLLAYEEGVADEVRRSLRAIKPDEAMGALTPVTLDEQSA